MNYPNLLVKFAPFLLAMSFPFLPLLAALDETVAPLENPMSVEYLEANLAKTHPRLVLTPSIEHQARSGSWGSTR